MPRLKNFMQAESYYGIYGAKSMPLDIVSYSNIISFSQSKMSK